MIFKNKASLILIVFTTLISSCRSNKQITFSPEELYARENFATNYDQYEYIVHKQDSSYKLANPVYRDGVITGKRTRTNKFNPGQASRRERKKQVHIYPKNGSMLISSYTDKDSTVRLYKEEIQNVKMHPKSSSQISLVNIDGLYTVYLVLLAIFLALVGFIALSYQYAW